jgi:hypothetical protein
MCRPPSKYYNVQNMPAHQTPVYHALVAILDRVYLDAI